MRPSPTAIATALRRRYERVEGLPLEAQIRELVDYLENPEVLVAEFADAYCAVDGCADADELILQNLSPQLRGPLGERFAAGAVLQLEGSDTPELRCLSGPVPLLADADDWQQRGLDYIALAGVAGAAPVLGVIEWLPGTTVFTLLMRALCCLTEIAPTAHLERVNESLFKGALAPDARFELQLVIQSGADGELQRTLGQLTHDLAEAFRQAIAEEWQFPDLLRRISCLRAGAGSEPPIVEWIA